jgi:transcriptional regulator NrdR family protein
MVCIYCAAPTRISNSRLQIYPNNVWRRRKCTSCRRIVTTIEQIDFQKTWLVVYTDRTESPFLRDKLLLSLHKSCQHRPSALPDAADLTATVIGRLRIAAVDGTLTATAIATVCHETLRRFDKAAATMYQAYHADVL